MKLLETGKEAIRPYYLRWLYFRLFPERRPGQFTNCWNYDFDRLPGAHSVAEGVRDERPGIIFLPMNDWHSRFQRTQHLAHSFVRLGYRALYVNPHFGRQFETSPIFDPAHRISALEPDLFEVHPRLTMEPVFHQRSLTANETNRVCVAIEQACQVLRVRRALQVVSFPVWARTAALLRERFGFPLVYDCHDELSGFGNVAAELLDEEHWALSAADLDVFSSEQLLNDNSAHDRAVGPKSILLRNGVDAEVFRPGMATPNLVVYAGALESWFDITAVRKAAEQNPGSRFVLAGRIDEAGLNTLRRVPNIEFRGELPYSAIPNLIASSRVGMIPFVLNRLTRATNPIKLYEYFACGLPVAATPLPEVEAFGDLVYIGSSPEDFSGAVRCALAEDDPRLRARRREVAENESWRARANDLLAALDTMCPGTHGFRPTPGWRDNVRSQ